MAKEELRCPKCDARVYPTDLACMDCGADLSALRTPARDQPSPQSQPGQLWMVGDASGQTWGPYTRAQLQQYVNEGRVLVDWEGSDGATKCTVRDILAQPGGPPQTQSAMDGLIPYKNMYALIAYYLAVFSIIPFVGILLGIGGFVLGILGLRYVKEHPEAKGKVHAWIGIIVGGLFGFGYLAALVFLIVGSSM